MKHLLCLLLVLVALVGCSTQASREEAYAKALQVHLDELAYLDALKNELATEQAKYRELLRDRPASMSPTNHQLFAEVSQGYNDSFARLEKEIAAQQAKVAAAEKAKNDADSAR